MSQSERNFRVLVAVVATGVCLSACRSSPKSPAAPFVAYTVSGQTVEVVSACTPFEDDVPASQAFVHWFKRGFETGLAGLPPLAIEWDGTPKGKAGRRGYDFGLEEGEKYRAKQKAPGSSRQTVPIPPA